VRNNLPPDFVGVMLAFGDLECGRANNPLLARKVPDAYTTTAPRTRSSNGDRNATDRGWSLPS
jgi:hypothetical protein